MGNIGRHAKWAAGLLALCFALAAIAWIPVGMAFAGAAETSPAARNEKLVVRYALDETSTGAGATLAATKWDSGSQAFVADTAADATVQNNVNGADTGVVASVAPGKNGTALSFTGKAHARANFHLPADATGMTISLWVKNITTYWGSLIEFWDGNVGGRLGKGTMQGNNGRGHEKGEGDPWNANCSAHSDATFSNGGGWDSFVVTHNNTNGDNGGAYVDNMQSDTWYQLIFTVTSTEMKAYRNGVLKQTFNNGSATPILSDIMTAAKNQTAGKLGIRLAHDTTGDRKDVLDELRIYNGAMTDDEVRELYFEYDPAGELPYFVPEYYDATGITYPEEILLGGAASVTDGGGKKKGTMQNDVEYSYTPLTETATAERDEEGIVLDLSKGELHNTATVKFRRTLSLKAATLGYKVNGGANVNIPVPENAADDILVKVAPGTDLSKIGAGEIAVEKFAEDQAAGNYKTAFHYDQTTHTATVRCEYTPFPLQATYYTIRFAEQNTETFASMQISGGVRELTLSKEDFTDHSADVPVSDTANFSLTVRLSLAEGAQADVEHTYTAADLNGGKLTIAVTSESGTAETYYLVPVQVSSDATLSSLSAAGYTLTFDAATTDYTVPVSAGGGAALYKALTFATTSGKATAVKRYDVTENVITVTVTAEDGLNVKTYTIHVQEKSADATLAAILVNGEPLDGFSPDITEYTVKYTGTAPEITYTAADGNATVQMTDGDGQKIITVTAADGVNKKIYTVTLAACSTDASLVKLTLNGTEISFTENAATYTAPVGVRLEDIPVTLQVAAGAHGTYRFLKEENKIVVTVTAEDGVTTKEYTVSVTTSEATFAEGVTEDNTPASGGCGAAADGATVIIVAVGLLAGAGLFVRKLRKKH